MAAVGLGCGAMAAYVEPGRHWTFYEIDPNVVAVARNQFTYLKEARGTVDVVLGDARRKLAAEPDGTFGLIVLDAFTSDAIPVHLLTREAFALYARKLKPGGVIAVHLSNRYLDLPPLVARVAGSLDEPFTLKVDHDLPTEGEKADGKYPVAVGDAVPPAGRRGQTTRRTPTGSQIAGDAGAAVAGRLLATYSACGGGHED